MGSQDHMTLPVTASSFYPNFCVVKASTLPTVLCHSKDQLLESILLDLFHGPLVLLCKGPCGSRMLRAFTVVMT